MNFVSPSGSGIARRTRVSAMASGAAHRLVRNFQVSDSEPDDDEDRRVGVEPVANSETIVLSDDEDNAFPPPRTSIPQQAPPARHSVRDVLQSSGVKTRTEWLESCMNELATSHPGFTGLPLDKQAELCFGQFLMADFNAAAAESLPSSVHALHSTELPGPLVLQVDEMIDLGHPMRERYQEKPAKPGRTLKLSMTDGVQRVFGIEYRPIKALQVLAPAGFKISLKNVCVRRGLFLLVPEVLEILGGHVENLDAARVRAVQLITKPPRGRWTRRNGVEPSLVATATAAAWPSSSLESAATPLASNYRRGQHQDPSVSNDAQGCGPSTGVRATAVQNSRREARQQGAEHRHMQQAQHAGPSGQLGETPPMRSNMREAPAQHEGQRQALNAYGSTIARSEALSVSGLHPTGLGSSSVRQPDRHQTVYLGAVSTGGSAGVCVIQSTRLERWPQSEQHRKTQHERDAGTSRSPNAQNVEETNATQVSGERSELPKSSPQFGRLSLLSRRPAQSKDSAAVQAQADENILRPNEFERRALNIGSSTSSKLDALRDDGTFTYLAVLKEKTNSQTGLNNVVRGKVKCVITGVVSFQYKDGDEFKLHVHIEDGSLIAPASVEHQLVQKLVGCSPREMISRLRDPDTNKAMTGNMIRFQKLLQTFEAFTLLACLDQLHRSKNRKSQ